jgi:hypothetical protein
VKAAALLLLSGEDTNQREQAPPRCTCNQVKSGFCSGPHASYDATVAEFSNAKWCQGLASAIRLPHRTLKNWRDQGVGPVIYYEGYRNLMDDKGVDSSNISQ